MDPGWVCGNHLVSAVLFLLLAEGPSEVEGLGGQPAFRFLITSNRFPGGTAAGPVFFVSYVTPVLFHGDLFPEVPPAVFLGTGSSGILSFGLEPFGLVPNFPDFCFFTTGP